MRPAPSRNLPLSLSRSVLIALCLCLALGNAYAQVTLDALSRDGYGVVSIRRPHPNVLTVPAFIDGHKIGLVLDTGWAGDGLSLDNDYARYLRVQTEAATDGGKSATGKALKVRKATARMVEIGNAQLSGVPLYFGVFQAIRDLSTRRVLGVDGFLGSGFLETCSAVIDLHNLRLYLRPPGTGRRAVLGPALTAAGLAEVPFVMAQGSCLVDAEVNGTSGKMILDTGATLSGVDSRLASRMKTFGYSFGGAVDAAGVVSETAKAPLQSFKIGGVSVRASDMQMTKFGFYTTTRGSVIGLVGMDTLGQNWSIIDFGQHKLYIAKAQ